uniref:cytochrome c oxidase subunit III n=1 Tax=Brueelia nebulosa TaxID=2972756 RepID=UPI0023AAC9B0|nr:cytochrome c oxidase subunit III [Brueelia nebulosa]WCF77116.1 cytochrome c oxidase subunit 3 [Brueelia nebulosa]
MIDKHSFHLVDKSPWPLIMSLSVFSLIANFFLWMSMNSTFLFTSISFASFIMILFQWMRDIVRESTYQGNHSSEVCSGLYIGIMMFIISEVMFFFSFFFSFFFLALNPDIEIGSKWPPCGIEPLEYYLIPLLNTILLLSSGVSITWSHHSIISSKYSQSIISLVLTVILGVVFMFFQYQEYMESSFSMADSVYGSIFFISTGFHGMHVMVGIGMILVSLKRIVSLHFSKSHHLGFEVASWYWHFVDVVWLFLFISIYWWGS